MKGSAREAEKDNECSHRAKGYSRTSIQIMVISWNVISPLDCYPSFNNLSDVGCWHQCYAILHTSQWEGIRVTSSVNRLQRECWCTYSSVKKGICLLCDSAHINDSSTSHTRTSHYHHHVWLLVRCFLNEILCFMPNSSECMPSNKFNFCLISLQNICPKIWQMWEEPLCFFFVNQMLF